MDKKPTPSDVYDISKTTGALILGANRLDDYATKFLAKYCKDALVTPMPLPIEEMLADAKLTVKTASLSRNLDIFGCCLLLDGYVEVYDEEKDEFVPKFYEAGTLLFDPDSEWAYGEGCKRNTLIHEMIHWDKDQTYFKILERKNRKAKEDLYPIMCRQSRTNFEPPSGKRTKQNEVEWLEWQAHRLAPRVLMPKKMFRKKAEELLDNDIFSCDELIHQLVEFFIVSRSSVKIRLLEVGLEERISGLQDYEAVYAELNRTKDFVPLTLEESFQMLSDNPILEEWVEAYGLLFVDGYFVVPDKKNITVKNGEMHLTKRAKTNLRTCALNIREQHFITYKYAQEDLSCYAMMYKVDADEIDRRLLLFSPRIQSGLKESMDDKDVPSIYANAMKDILGSSDDETEKEFLRLLRDEDTTLCQSLAFMIGKKGWTDPLDFYENTLVHENYLKRIRDDEANKMESGTIMAICVGLGLRRDLIEEVYQKSERKLHPYQDPDRIWLKIIDRYPCISIVDFNRLIEVAKMEPIGTKDRKNSKVS